MPTLYGIDVGSLRTLSYVAWLREGQFRLDLYVPSRGEPLPRPPKGWDEPAVIGLDAPQGLPSRGTGIRSCDRAANTPTRRLPADRGELAAWQLYRGLVEAGVEIFWSAHNCGRGHVAGLPGTGPVLCETYPRYVIRRLWPNLAIPSKRNDPLTYVDAVWSRIQALGYACPSVERPAVDHVDAMLCALAAKAYLDAGGPPSGTVGLPPVIDNEAEVLREGFIIAP